MSNGGSAGSAGSTSQEATMEEDYNNTSTDLVDSSVSIDEFGTSPSSTTSVDDGYSSQDNEEQQAIDANVLRQFDHTAELISQLRTIRKKQNIAFKEPL